MRKGPHGDRIARRPAGRRAAFSLYRAGHAVSRRLGMMLAPMGISPCDALVLQVLSGKPGLHLHEAGRRLGLSRQTVAYAVTRMQQSRFLVRVPAHPANLACYRLSAAGRRLMAKVSATIMALDRNLGEQVGDADRHELLAILDRIAVAAELSYADRP